MDKEFEVALEEVRETRPAFRAVYDLVLPVHQEKWAQMRKRVSFLRLKIMFRFCFLVSNS